MPKFEAKCAHCDHIKFITDLGDLKCDQCGAPLSDFKRVESIAEKPIIVERVIEREIIKEVPAQQSKAPKKKKKKGLLKRIADVADDVLDIFD